MDVLQEVSLKKFLHNLCFQQNFQIAQNSFSKKQPGTAVLLLPLLLILVI